MDGIVLTTGGLGDLVSSFGANFFPAILATVEALAPWIVAVAGAIAAYRLVRNFVYKVMNVGGGDGGTHIARRRRILDRDIRMMRSGRPLNYKQLRKQGVDDDDIPLSSFDYKEYNRVNGF